MWSKTLVGLSNPKFYGLIGQTAHRAETKVDRAQSQLPRFQMAPVAQDNGSVEGSARLRAIPVHKLVNGVTVAAGNQRWSGCLARRLWRAPDRATVGFVWLSFPLSGSKIYFSWSGGLHPPGHDRLDKFDLLALGNGEEPIEPPCDLAHGWGRIGDIHVSLLSRKNTRP
jgi:hypothetical protein